MGIGGLDHVNIRVSDVLATLKFYADALGLKATGMVKPEPSAEGGWLRDDSGRAIIHVGALTSAYPGDDGEPIVARFGSGAVHHVALNCSDISSFKRKFEQAELEWSENLIPEVGLAQLFLQDPNGIMLELNFFGEG